MVSLSPRMTLRHFPETAQSFPVGVQSSISGCTDAMMEKGVLVGCVGNVEYRFALYKYVCDEVEVKCCVLKCSCGVVEMLVALNAIL